MKRVWSWLKSWFVKPSQPAVTAPSKKSLTRVDAISILTGTRVRGPIATRPADNRSLEELEQAVLNAKSPDETHDALDVLYGWRVNEWETAKMEGRPPVGCDEWVKVEAINKSRHDTEAAARLAIAAALKQLDEHPWQACGYLLDEINEWYSAIEQCREPVGCDAWVQVRDNRRNNQKPATCFYCKNPTTTVNGFQTAHTDPTGKACWAAYSYVGQKKAAARETKFQWDPVARNT